MRIGEHEVVVISKDKVKVGCVTAHRSEVQEVLKLMEEWKQLKVGDYVRVLEKVTLQRTTGRIGKVVFTEVGFLDERPYFAVEFAEYDRNLPGCTSNRRGAATFDVLPEYHGAWFEAHELEVVE